MIVKNFLFHRVSDEEDLLWPPMKPELFDKIINRLSKRFLITKLEDVLAAPELYNKSGKPIATILFDDGYKDNIEYAAPILKAYNCLASFYVVTDCIDRNVPTWTYIVDFVLQNTHRSFIELDYTYIPDSLKKLPVGNNINPATKKLKPWMKGLPNLNRLEIMKAITDQCSDVVIPRNQMMSWNEIRQLNNDGFIIGSHTNTHPTLGQLENSNEIEEELQVSFVKIKNEVGISPQTISYPIGTYDKRVIELSKNVGYKQGLAVEQKFYETAKDSRFSIPRVELYQEPWYKVNARVTGIYSAVKRLWK